MKRACVILAVAAMASATWAAEKTLTAKDLASIVRTACAKSPTGAPAEVLAKSKGKPAELTGPVERLDRDDKAGTVTVTLHYVSPEVREFGQRGTTEKGPLLEYWVVATLKAEEAATLHEGTEATLAGKIATFTSTSKHPDICNFRVELSAAKVK